MPSARAIRCTRSRIEEVIGLTSIVATEATELLWCWDPRNELDVRALLSALGIPTASYAIALSPVCATPV
jgi:hypothetical protein